MLGVSYQTLYDFLEAHPEAKAVWEDGKGYGRASLRRRLWWQAMDDPVQARFLAKVSHRLHITSFKSTPSRSSRTAVDGVMVFMPPGAAKSTYLWLMGRKKGTNVIAISYSQDVANRFGRRVRHIVRSDDYARIMDTAIVADNHAVDNWALENGSDYRAAGANASVTSVRADWVLIDDHPVKGRESADSDLQRETIWTTLNDDVFTRMKPNAKILIAMTRWHARVKSRLRSSRSIPTTRRLPDDVERPHACMRVDCH